MPLKLLNLNAQFSKLKYNNTRFDLYSTQYVIVKDQCKIDLLKTFF